jgi:hypothetical protein
MKNGYVNFFVKCKEGLLKALATELVTCKLDLVQGFCKVLGIS